MEICNMICSIITAIATVALAIFAFQARNSYLRQELYSFAWDFLDKYRNLRDWIIHNLDNLDLQKNQYNEEFDKAFWAKLDMVEKLLLKIDISTEAKFFTNTKQQFKLCHELWINYATKKDGFDRKCVQTELLKHIEMEEFIEFVKKNRG